MPTVILKCCLFVLVTGLVSLLMRDLCGGTWGLLCGVLGGIVLFVYAVSFFEDWLSQIGSLVEKSGLSGKEWGVMIKCTMICICVDFTADFCKSAGQPMLAHGLELTGRIGIALLAIPYVLEVLSLIESVLQA